MKKIKLLLLICIVVFVNNVFAQIETCIENEGLSITYSKGTKYCEDFSNYGGTKIFYDVYEVKVTLYNNTSNTIYYSSANISFTGEKGICGTGFAKFSGRIGIPPYEKIEKKIYVHTEKGVSLPEPQCGLTLVPKDKQPPEPYTEFSKNCFTPPCEKKDFSEKDETTFTDSRDGKSYKTVKIGDQTWMAENLNYEISDSWCYDNNSSNCNTYGRLYTWVTAQNVCPSGWHLPSRDEWNILFEYLKNKTKITYCPGGTRCIGLAKHLIAGDYLTREVRLADGSHKDYGWDKKNWKMENGTNDFGFTALHSGIGNTIGTFQNELFWGTYWSTNQKHSMFINHNANTFGRQDYNKPTYLRSVRCIMN